MPRSSRLALVAVIVLASLALLHEGPAAHAATDWQRFADEQTVTAVTRDEDGSVRETTVWLLVLDGDAFLRTGGTRWGGNVERDPEIDVRVAGEEVPVRVELIEDPELRQRVIDGFREKYGFSDRLVALFRGSTPLIMRLAPRQAAAAAGESGNEAHAAP
jgi:hypothetical protein